MKFTIGRYSATAADLDALAVSQYAFFLSVGLNAVYFCAVHLWCHVLISRPLFYNKYLDCVWTHRYTQNTTLI